MDTETVIAIFCSIGGLVIGLLGWIRNQKKDYNEEGENRAIIKDLLNEVNFLHKKNEQLEGEVKEKFLLLENKIDGKFENFQKEINSIHKTNNKTNVEIGKISTSVNIILKKLEKI